MKKRLYIAALALIAFSPAFAGRVVSYARANQNVTFDLGWNSGNYGSIRWQKSADGGSTWTDIANATQPVLTVKATGPALYRAVVDGDPSCPPVIEERELKTVDVSASVLTLGPDYVEMEVSASDLKDAGVVEYGFTAALQGVGRTYSILPRTKLGASLPEGDGSILMRCEGLLPDTQYSIRPYFVTADGSMIFGAGKLATTIGGIRFDSEDWIIEKTSVQIPFSIPGISGNTSPELWLGKDRASLKKYEIESLGNQHYRSQLITGLEPGTSYLAVATARIDGDEVEI